MGFPNLVLPGQTTRVLASTLLNTGISFLLIPDYKAMQVFSFCFVMRQRVYTTFTDQLGIYSDEHI
jgi:hypothetical protein